MSKLSLSPTGGSYDQAARASSKVNSSSCISWLLSASYAYYCRYVSLLTDECFDKMCKYVLDNYDNIVHPHKHLLTKEMLVAGTAYNIKMDEYPLIVRVSTEKMIEELETEENGK